MKLWIAALLIGVVAVLSGFQIAPGSLTATTTGPVLVMLNGQIVGSGSALNIITPGSPNGLVPYAQTDPPLGSIDIGWSVNTAYVASINRVFGNIGFLPSTNGTTSYTVTVPVDAAPQLGMAFDFLPDVTCATSCTLQFIYGGNLEGSPISIYQSNGTTTPNGLLIGGQAKRIWYDGVVFRIE